MTRLNLLYLNNTAQPVPRALAALPNVHVSDVPQYGASLAGADIVYVPMHADQRDLAARQDLLQFLDRGGVILFNGHIAHPFHPALKAFVSSSGQGLARLRVERLVEHSLFERVPLDTLNFTKGVAGFYARGGNPAPPEATVFHVVGPDRLPVDWLFTTPGGGVIFVHSGNDIIPFLQRAGALERFIGQIVKAHADSH